MTKNPDWTTTEVTLIVGDYFDMLRKESEGTDQSRFLTVTS